MKPPPNGKCLTVDQLTRLLQPLARDHDPWQDHVAKCSSCRRSLEELAGDGSWWEAASFLTQVDDPELGSLRARMTQSVCAMSVEEAGATRPQDPLSEFEIQQLQQLLAPASHPELLGRIGRYELEQLVGRGGMGLVFRARDVELQRVVAVKTLAVHLLPIAAARERFVREARASAALTHPHIVPVYDVITDGQVPAIVMQYVAGPTLEAWLRSRGPLPWAEVLQLGVQLSDALAVAHASGLVHRDVKPGNVLLEADGSRALLTDFGLVRTLSEATLTRSGMLAGTPDYMSPEQARGEPVGASSDLFSLGSLLYAMLSGHPPFRGGDPLAVMNRICHQRHAPLQNAQPKIPLEICRLVNRLLAKEPRRRFASAAELHSQLLELSHSPLRLTTSRLEAWLRHPPRRVAVLLSVLLASLLLAAAVGPLTSWLTWPAARHAGQPRQTPSNVVETNTATGSTALQSPPADAADGQQFTELQIIDQRLRSLAEDLGHLERDMAAGWLPGVTHSPESATGFEHQTRQLDRQLQILEHELHSLPPRRRN